MPIEDHLLAATKPAPTTHATSRAPERDADYEILHLLETHGAREGAALDAYQRVAADTTAGPAIRYLVDLILEDEERHHRVFAEMANQVRSFLTETDIQPRVPALAARADPDLLAETRRLLEFERDDAKELKELRKVVKRSPRSSLQPLLVEMMRHDTAKHIAILEFIEHQLRGR
jgi:rubrerythrin